jgi:hypothetical protein
MFPVSGSFRGHPRRGRRLPSALHIRRCVFPISIVLRLHTRGDRRKNYLVKPEIETDGIAVPPSWIRALTLATPLPEIILLARPLVAPLLE